MARTMRLTSWMGACIALAGAIWCATEVRAGGPCPGGAPEITFYEDFDGDGFGDPGGATCQGCDVADCEAMDPTINWVDNADDCDDSDPGVTQFTFYEDFDGDGFGDPGGATCLGCVVADCTAMDPTIDWVNNDDDCDDTNPAIGLPQTWYEDLDGDGFGDPSVDCFGCPADCPGFVDNDQDNCPTDPDKTDPGVCGCGVSDVDTDGDGTPDCNDGCPADPDKTAPGACGCGVSDVDTDGDGTPDCNDGCPNDPNKTAPGTAGCGNPEPGGGGGGGGDDNGTPPPGPGPSPDCGTCGAGGAALMPLMLFGLVGLRRIRRR